MPEKSKGVKLTDCVGSYIERRGKWDLQSLIDQYEWTLSFFFVLDLWSNKYLCHYLRTFYIPETLIFYIEGNTMVNANRHFCLPI